MAGAVAVGLCALAPLPGRDDPAALAVLGVGAALLAAALDARGVAAAAGSVEALVAAAAGLLFAFAFGVPAVVVAVPPLVAGIDVASLLTGSADAAVPAAHDPDVLTVDLPRLGGGGDVAQLGLLDLAFLAMFAAWSGRFALRPRATLPLMVAALAGSVALGVAAGAAVPALPFVAAGFLLPAADRLPALVRRARAPATGEDRGRTPSEYGAGHGPGGEDPRSGSP